jgi:hypothetical protein
VRADKGNSVYLTTEGNELTTDRQELTPAPIRIDVRRALKALLLTLVLPVTAAVLIDVTTGLLPSLTIVAALICIPLATIVVNRTVLAEFERVVKIVAPELPPVDASAMAETAPGEDGGQNGSQS